LLCNVNITGAAGSFKKNGQELILTYLRKKQVQRIVIFLTISTKNCLKRAYTGYFRRKNLLKLKKGDFT